MEDGIVAFVLKVALLTLCGFYLLVIFASNIFFQHLEEKYKWVRRQWRFLDALLRDIQKVQDSVEEIKRRAAHQLRDPELNLEGITLPLNHKEMQWWKNGVKVAYDAKRCLESFEELKGRRDFLSKYFLVFISLIPIKDVSKGMKKTNEAINNRLKNQKLVKGVCGLLEQSRNRVRNLQVRLIGKTENDKILDFVLPSLSPVLAEAQELIGDQSMVEQFRSTVKLLHAFLEDLKQLRLDSVSEKVWAEEANLILEEANQNITSTTVGVLLLREAAKTSKWPLALALYFREWIARRKLQNSIKYFDSVFHDDLFKAKDTYVYTFTVRSDSSKLVRSHDLIQLQQFMSDDGVLISPLPHIRRLVDQFTETHSDQSVHAESRKMCERLKDLQKLLEDKKATEVSINTRTLCLDLLKKMAEEAENFANTANTEEISSSKLLPEFNKILQTMIQVCRISVIEDSCSIVGLEKDVDYLVSKLVPSTMNDVEPPFISIVGMEGIGKTTLAKEIFNQESIIRHFRCRLFLSVPQVSDKTMFLQNVENLIPLTQDNKREKDGWESIMVGSSEEKPCLVVLDNVWSTEAWDILNNAVFSKLSDCTIMLTTRHKKVALRANPNSIIHPVRLRTEGQSWELFTQMVNCPSEAKDLAKEVVAGTGGLPLAILRLGYRLPKATTDELSRVLQRISHGQNQTPWLETSEKIEEKPIMAKCFSYFEFFPRDFTIPSRRLVALWVASKFFEVGEVGKESKQGGNLGEDEKKNCREEVAEEYLNKLIDCNMVQIVETKRNGEVKSCRFPSILGDIWVRGSPNKKTAHSWFLFLSSDRQLAYRFDDNDASNGRRIRGLEYSLDVSPEEKSPRSIMFFDSREGEKPGEEIGNFLLKGISSRRFHNLFVLDFEGLFRPNLPKSLGELKRLTYLGLRWTYLETLPPSIDNLSQLETLDLKHTYVRTLPISTWKLKKLRHLYLNQHCRVKLKPLPSTSSMKDLQTLCGVVVDHKASALTDGLEKLFSLRKLEVTILDSARQEGFLNKIKNLVQLTSLRLRSINKKGEAQVLKLGSLSQLKKLTSLYLLGKLENPSNCLSELPENLTELTLSATGLSEDPMNMLGSRLRGLKFLSFLAGSFVGTRMVCHGRDFPKLLVLRIWGLSTLEELEVHEGVMQRPWKFDKRNCQKLIIKTVETNNNEADHSDAIST